MVDVGGESTRPGAPQVSPRDQIDRVLGVVRYAVSAGACVSIDTGDPEVAAACLDAGAHAVNDVTCLRDERLADVVAQHEAGLVLMHARGRQEDMAGFSQYPDDAYNDVVTEVCAEWESAAQRACSHGVRAEAMVMDPGLGFAKNARQSTELLARIGEIVDSVDAPVAVGASRKSFLTVVDPGAPGGRPSRRLDRRSAARGEGGCSVVARSRRPGHAPGRGPRSAPLDVGRRVPHPPPCAWRRFAGGRVPTRLQRELADARGLSPPVRAQTLRAGPDRRRRHPARRLHRVPRVARAARHPRDADGHRPRRPRRRLPALEVGGLRDAALPAQRAPDHSHRGRRLSERHPPGADARRRAGVPVRAVAPAGVQGHRRGGVGGDRARTPPYRRSHRLRAGREPRRVRGRPGHADRRGGAAGAARQPVRARDAQQAPRRGGGHPQPACGQGGRLFPHARHQAPRQIAGLAASRGPRHHGRDRCGRRRRERGARQHQLLLQ